MANDIFLARAEPGVGATVSHNLFGKTDPQFVPGSQFQLSADSPARNAGLVRAPYAVAAEGSAPDLGAFAYGVPPWSAGSSLAKSQKPPAQLQRDLVNLRFGIFIHLSPATYLDLPDHLQPDHAPPRQGKDGISGTADDLSPALVNPSKLDCGQWADAAKSAGMKFAVPTTKHHGGWVDFNKNARKDVFEDSAQTIEMRVSDLLSRLTLEEKATMLDHKGPTMERFNIRSDQWNQCLNGVKWDRPTTLFPVCVAMAATFDTNLVQEVANVLWDEARAIYDGRHFDPNAPGEHKGLIYRAPVINIDRNPY